MDKTKEEKVKKQRSFASRSSSSSRPGLEQTVARVDPPGSTSADGHDDEAASGTGEHSGSRQSKLTMNTRSKVSH